MATRTYTYKMYNKLVRFKTLGILSVFALFGVGVGLSEGKLNIASIVAGLFLGSICLVFANNMRMAYELRDDSMKIGMTFLGFMIPTLSKSISYEDIEGFEWVEVNKKIGRHTVTADENEYFNLGGDHIKIIRRGKSNIVFSATEGSLEELRGNFQN